MSLWLTASLANALASVFANTFTPLEPLVGDWCGTGLGGAVVERWSEPVGDAMTGTFTASKDGTVTFHEFWAVVEGENGLEIRLKHFHPNLASWEAQDEVAEFPFLRADESGVYFEGLGYERPSADVMIATVSTPNGDLRLEFGRCGSVE